MDAFPTLENRLPPETETFRLKTADGLTLRGIKSGNGRERGTILLLNGRADFAERYFETMRELVARGFCVATFDWRGQGASQRLVKDRLRGWINSFKSYDEDLRTAMDQLLRAHCPGPYYALAHSTGGNILLRAILRETWFSKAVVTAPLLELNYGAWPQWLARLLTFVMTSLGLSWMFLPGMRRQPLMAEPFSENPLTNSQERWERDGGTIARYPELAVGGATFGWLRAAMDSISTLRLGHFPKGPKCPVLMVLAGRDRVVNNSAAEDFARRVPGVSVVYIQDSLHEILMERDVIREEFLAGLDNYLAEGAATS